jgi:hypothetical protein
MKPSKNLIHTLLGTGIRLVKKKDKIAYPAGNATGPGTNLYAVKKGGGHRMGGGGGLHLNRTLIVDAVPEGPLDVLLGTSVLL